MNRFRFSFHFIAFFNDFHILKQRQIRCSSLPDRNHCVLLHFEPEILSEMRVMLRSKASVLLSEVICVDGG